MRIFPSGPGYLLYDVKGLSRSTLSPSSRVARSSSTKQRSSYYTVPFPLRRGRGWTNRGLCDRPPGWKCRLTDLHVRFFLPPRDGSHTSGAGVPRSPVGLFTKKVMQTTVVGQSQLLTFVEPSLPCVCLSCHDPSPADPTRRLRGIRKVMFTVGDLVIRVD